MLGYLARLNTGKIILWCYLVWYVVTVANYFDASIAIWANAIGISAVIGVALMLSVSRKDAPADHWQTFRLFLMPFCVSSFSQLIKGKGFWLIFPPSIDEFLVSVGACVVFVLLVIAVKKVRR